ncbi:MAG: flagellar assembly protein FliW [Nitrospira sp.]|nr:flagellar assembly protein FliW [Nitrospira sp.]
MVAVRRGATTGFVILDPAYFKPDYRITIPTDAVLEIQKNDDDELSVATILTIPSDDPTAVTANPTWPVGFESSHQTL